MMTSLPGASTGRQPTIEWQVAGACNYDCSYCIQSPVYRVGQPTAAQVDAALTFFATLPGPWEVKMTGGEPFAFKGFVEVVIAGLIERTPHVVSVLTNLSAPAPVLDRFAALTFGRLGVVSASLHLEFVDVDTFATKAARLRDQLHPDARFVVNSVLVPGRLDAVLAARERLAAVGLTLYPQLMKVGPGVAEYGDSDQAALASLLGPDPNPRQANVAPSYQGRTCWTGVDYFVLLQNGDAWSCRTARRHKDGYLGNVFDGTFVRRSHPRVCPWTICPCSVPANRGMIEAAS